jgi:Fe-S-cluster containining protein
MRSSLPVLNADSARYECIFGRGCDGICCQNGRPPVYDDEVERIQANLQKFLPELQAAARRLVERRGFLSNRRKLGLPMLRVSEGWCVFFNKGCVLHKVGAEEGDKYRYKPAACALFPLAKTEADEWYVRQHGYQDEKWDLFCLDPKATELPARQTLAEEMQLGARYDAEAAVNRKRPEA